MQSTEGITVSLSPVDIDVLQDALSVYFLDVAQKLEKTDLLPVHQFLLQSKISQSKDLFHKISKKQ